MVDKKGVKSLQDVDDLNIINKDFQSIRRVSIAN